jgi:methyl-accepting chemotaxis protein
MRSLWLKLMGAFALVILVGTGVIVFLTGRATTGQFELYVTQTGQQWAASLAPLLADYYARTGSRDGVEPVLRNPWMTGATAPGTGQGWMMGGMEGGMMGHMGEGAGHSQQAMSGMMMGDSMWAMSGNRLILTNAEGNVVADTAEALLGTRLAANAVGRGMPITFNEQRVGTLIVTPFEAPVTSASEFLSAVNRSVLWAGLIAGAVALVLGSGLFFQVVRPLHSLSTAAQGIAQGDLSQRALVGARDEVGQVAVTFNQMAESLQRYAAERQNMIADIAHELRPPSRSSRATWKPC